MPLEHPEIYSYKQFHPIPERMQHMVLVTFHSRWQIFPLFLVNMSAALSRELSLSLDGMRFACWSGKGLSAVSQQLDESGPRTALPCPPSDGVNGGVGTQLSPGTLSMQSVPGQYQPFPQHPHQHCLSACRGLRSAPLALWFSHKKEF